jgi:hypothetical protein
VNIIDTGRDPWMGDRPVANPVLTHTTQRRKECVHICMPWAGFEHQIRTFQHSKNERALNLTTTDVVVVYINVIWPFLSFPISNPSSCRKEKLDQVWCLQSLAFCTLVLFCLSTLTNNVTRRVWGGGGFELWPLSCLFRNCDCTGIFSVESRQN